MSEGGRASIAPPCPQGVERNVVITQWDWVDPKAYLHDEISTDKRNPTLNANGLIYGSPEESRDYLPVLDPVHNTTSQVKVPCRDPDTPGQPSTSRGVASATVFSLEPGDHRVADEHHNPTEATNVASFRRYHNGRERPAGIFKMARTMAKKKSRPVAPQQGGVVSPLSVDAGGGGELGKCDETPFESIRNRRVGRLRGRP